jgi:hypothetical protein
MREGERKAAAFLNLFGRPDSGFAASPLCHRDAGDAKNFCSAGPEAFAAPKPTTQLIKSFCFFFFRKRSSYLLGTV